MARERTEREKRKKHHSKHHKRSHSRDREKRRRHSSSSEEDHKRASSHASKEKKQKVKDSKSSTSLDYTTSDQLTAVTIKEEPIERGAEKSKTSSSGKPPSKKKCEQQQQQQHSSESERTASRSADGEVSLSVEETNKLRAKLGLKPLDVDGGKEKKEEKTSDGEDVYVPHKEVFVKTENISAKQLTEKTKEKLAYMKEKRRISEKLKGVKGIASEDEEEDAAGWIEKSRKLQEEKMKAQQKAKMLEEMDKEIDEASQAEQEAARKKSKAYTAGDLAGLKVGHSEEVFREGEQIVLTLRDKEVLDENDDVLENVNILDAEKAKKNIENKTKKPGYRPYDEPEYDEFGILKPNSLLSKYDEEIEPAKPKMFQIGKTAADRDSELALIREKLRKQQGVVSLEMPASKIASEYYTEEEMARFKKPKKVRKVMRRKTNITEEIEPVAHSSSDHASRKKPKEQEAESTNGVPELKPMSKDVEMEEVNDDMFEGLHAVQIEEDEAEQELQRALEKTRKLKTKEIKAEPIEKIAEEVKRRAQDDEPLEEEDNTCALLGKDSNLVLNCTAEFCRNLGDLSTFHSEPNEDDDIMDFEKEAVEEKKRSRESDGDESRRGKWNEVDLDAEKSNDEYSLHSEGPILEEEPDVSRGLAGALKLAMKKGYLDKETKGKGSAPRHSLLQAKNYTIEEKFYEDDKQGRRERYQGPVSEFKDKNGYKPDVKLEYVDSNGRVLNQKEAFRVLSHKFHGKGPGKNKIDKRMKKLEQESKLRQMNSTDTPLGTLKLLQDKQKELHSPYVVLSGGPTSLTKK